MSRRLLAAAGVVVLAAVAPAGAQEERPTLPPGEYGRWESLGRHALSPDGRWIAYEITRVDETRELRIRPLDRDTVRVVPDATDPVFSPDGRWLAWTVGPSEEERERLEEAAEPVREDAGLIDLATGEERAFPAVAGLAFDATGGFLTLLGYPPEEPDGAGGDLRVLDLRRGTEVGFGGVSETAWSDAGSLLAMVLANGADAGDAVQLWDAATGRLTGLDASPSVYRRLAWREDAPDLAVLRSAGAVDGDTAYVPLAWRGLDGGEARRFELDTLRLPDGLVVVEHAAPRWSDDGRLVALGLRPAADAGAPADTAAAAEDSTAAEAEDGPELPDVQIWHPSDVRIPPAQVARSDEDARATLLAVWRLDEGGVVQVGTDLRGEAELLEGWRHGLERLADPYPWGAMFGRRYHDAWTVDLASGERRRVLERVRWSWPSGDGRWVLTFDGRDYHAVDPGTGARANLTAGLPAAFADTAYDTPTDMLPPHGIAGWTDGDGALLAYDEFDVWRVAPDGSGGVRLTRGAEEAVVHRVEDLDGERPTFDPAEPLWLSLRGEWSETRGFARLSPGAAAPERLLWEDRLLRGLERADSADVFLWRAEARDDSPDLFVAGPTLASPRAVTRTNPWLADHAWTRAELVGYTSEAGVPLQGGLLYPAGWEPGRRYPMIVYAYEILTPQVHAWEGPSERDYYSFVRWTQEGYFVLLPDVVFRARDPGVSLVEAIRPAVGAVVDRGLVDPDRVGFIGHSWGGYEATYLATHTDLFAAAVAGAPLTDFLSVMGQIHWNGGVPEVDHWETGQARMEVPYWEDPEAHRRNSPIERVHLMETPLLLAHGDEDGVVEFFQSTELFNFARRAGKQVVLLVYEGEDHGFRDEANQVDYHRRIVEWFGHYLKGEPAPAWITEGVPLEALEAEKRRVAGSGGG